MVATRRSRSAPACSDRTRSTARRCAIVKIQLVAEPLLRVEAGGVAPDLDQDLLRDLLGLRRIAKDPSGQAEDAGRDELVELLEGPLVAVGGAGEQLVRRRRRRRPARIRAVAAPGASLGVVPRGSSVRLRVVSAGHTTLYSARTDGGWVSVVFRNLRVVVDRDVRP